MVRMVHACCAVASSRIDIAFLAGSTLRFGGFVQRSRLRPEMTFRTFVCEVYRRIASARGR